MSQAIAQTEDQISDSTNVVEARYNLIDKAARKSDRWWMLVLLMFIIATFTYRDYQAQQTDRLNQVEIRTIRKDQMEYVTTKSDAVTAALINNTRALEENTQMLRRIEARP